MTEFNELDYLLELDTGGAKKYKGNDAMDSRINEWLDTPEGTVADDPSWGNPFRRFQFDPISPFFEVEVQMAVAGKIRQDIPSLAMIGIAVESISNDLVLIYIRHQYGATSTKLLMSGI